MEKWNFFEKWKMNEGNRKENKVEGEGRRKELDQITAGEEERVGLSKLSEEFLW